MGRMVPSALVALRALPYESFRQLTVIHAHLLLGDGRRVFLAVATHPSSRLHGRLPHVASSRPLQRPLLVPVHQLCSASWCALRLLLPVGVLDEQAERLGVRAVRSKSS
jgi:hypothetical protein